MSRTINQNTEPLFIFDMPDDEVLSQTISVQGEKGERGDPTKTSQLINDSDFTTNAALAAGLAAKADLTDYQATAAQVDANTAAIEAINSKSIAIKGGNGSSLWYYPIAVLPKSDTQNGASINIRGKIGDYQGSKSANLDISIINRGGYYAFGDYFASSADANSSIDFVIYENENETATLYMRAYHYFSVNLDLSLFGCTDEYDGTYLTTEPDGTLVWSLSTNTSVQKAISGTISANIDGDAHTVNGHTVNADVPINAVFTDTVYDDTAIQESVAAKADNDDVAATYATKTELTSNISDLRAQIAGIEDGSPTIVSSTSSMTDTDKLYILSSDMHIYYYSGSAWIDSGIAYGTDATSITGYSTSLGGAGAWSVFGNDYNNLKGNKIYRINPSNSVADTLSNQPVSRFNGTLIAYNFKTPDADAIGTVQIAIRRASGSVASTMYFRVLWGSSVWGSWVALSNSNELAAVTDTANKALAPYGTNLSSLTAWNDLFSGDYDNLTPNKVYLVSQGSYSVAHEPVLNFNGTVFTYSWKQNESLGEVQLAVAGTSAYMTSSGNALKMYYRIKWGGTAVWSSWICINDLATIEKTPNYFCAFQNVGCIGDSLASGEAVANNGGTTRYIDMYQFSWGQYMAKMTGNTYYNFSKGGLTTRTWLTDGRGLPLATDGNHACEAYIIGLGVNDRLKLGSGYLGTISDIDTSDYTNNADTYYGNYGRIIQTLQALYPKAKFFLLTDPVTDASDGFNQAVRDIANLLDNCYLIDLYANQNPAYTSGIIGQSRRAGHYNAIAYKEIAEIMLKELNRYIANNASEFMQVEFINTDNSYS